MLPVARSFCPAAFGFRLARLRFYLATITMSPDGPEIASHDRRSSADVPLLSQPMPGFGPAARELRPVIPDLPIWRSSTPSYIHATNTPIPIKPFWRVLSVNLALWISAHDWRRNGASAVGRAQSGVEVRGRASGLAR